MNSLLQPLNEEQKKQLHNLHLIQQKELQELIRKHQLEQLQIFEQAKKEQMILEQMEQLKHEQSSISQASFKPYTLSQYKQLKLQPILKNPGQGLGPTMEIHKWQKSKDKMERMYEFAEQVKLRKNIKPRSEQKPLEQHITVRQRALEFARQLKPIGMRQQKRVSQQMSDEKEIDELEEYEIRNKQLKAQINQIK